jgi:hypothetical protein
MLRFFSMEAVLQESGCQRIAEKQSAESFEAL